MSIFHTVKVSTAAAVQDTRLGLQIPEVTDGFFYVVQRGEFICLGNDSTGTTHSFSIAAEIPPNIDDYFPVQVNVVNSSWWHGYFQNPWSICWFKLLAICPFKHCCQASHNRSNHKHNKRQILSKNTILFVE